MSPSFRERAARLAQQGAELAQQGAERARDSVTEHLEVGPRLRELLEMDDDTPVSAEVLLVKLVGAVRGDETQPRTREEVETAAERRQRAAGAAMTIGGEQGAQLFGLYSEAAIFADVAQLHRLPLTDEQLVGHLLVFWSAAPDQDSALRALTDDDISLISMIGTRVRGSVSDKPVAEMTKRDVVRALWKARGTIGDGRPNALEAKRRDMLFPGKRARAAIEAAEQQLGVAGYGVAGL